MLIHLKIIDEPAHERLGLRVRLSYWHLLSLLFYSALSLGLGALAWKAWSDVAPLAGVLPALLSFASGLWAFITGYGLLFGMQALTLTRGRVELSAFGTQTVYSRQDIRCVELRYTCGWAHGEPLHALKLWLVLREPPPGAHPEILLTGMTVPFWRARERQLYFQLDEALARLGLREKAEPTEPPSALEAEAPQPRIAVRKAALEPRLRAALRGPRSLPPGARFYPDAEADGAASSGWALLASLCVCVPLSGVLVASVHAAVWRQAPLHLLALLGAAAGVLFCIWLPAWCLRGLLRGHQVARGLAEGLWTSGLYLLKDTLLQEFDDHVTLIPRERILAFACPYRGALHVHYRSARGLREVLRLKTGPGFPQGQRALLDELEAWRTHATPSGPR
jgi:hypothetical protein